MADARTIRCRGGPLDGQYVPYGGTHHVYSTFEQVVPNARGIQLRTYLYELWCQSPPGGGTYQQRVREWYQHVEAFKEPGARP